MTAPTRRQVLVGAGVGAAAVAAGLGVRWALNQPGPHHAEPGASPFALGVASGDPLSDAVVIWTRLAADHMGTPPPGVPPAPAAAGVEVAWEVALDENFHRVVRRGTTTTRADTAHSVHVDVTGLASATRYHYRFHALGELSPAGRTRTLPAANSEVGSLRFAVSSCQRYSDGYYTAYRQLVADDPAFMLWLGDYIYESPAGRTAVRPEPPRPSGSGSATTLADYRIAYAWYKADPDLRAAHAAVPWVVTWDDHEVTDNYAGSYRGRGATEPVSEEFLIRRAAAYQAWWEHTPVRVALDPGALARDPTTELRIYRGFDVGRLARVSVLDTRQYRSGIAKDTAAGRPSVGDANEAGTMTGAQQEEWLLRRLRESGATWNVVAQQVMMSPSWFGPIVNLDQWDGFVPQRRRILSSAARDEVANLVVLSGDIHTTWANVLSSEFASVSDPQEGLAAGALGVELVAPPMSSAPPTGFVPAALASNAVTNPAVRWFDGSGRGYLRCDVTPTEWTAVPVVSEDPGASDASLREGPTLVVTSGVPDVTVRE